MDRWNGTDGQNGGEDKMEQVDKTNKVDKTEQVEMEFHMIDIIYAALPMGAQTEKTTFSCKDD